MAKPQSRQQVFLSPMFIVSSAVLVATLIVVTLLSVWRVGQVWPLLLVATGIAGVISSLGSRGKVATGYLISSMGFILLGIVFSLFSFKLIPGSFGTFVLMWWPSFVVAGIVFLLSAYGYSRYRHNKSELRPDRRPAGHKGKRSGNRSGR